MHPLSERMWGRGERIKTSGGSERHQNPVRRISFRLESIE